MQRIRTRVKTLPDIWAGDKELLRLGYPNIQIDWDKPFPVERDVRIIVEAEGQKWENPDEPVEVSEEFANDSRDKLIGEVEGAWGERFLEKPNIEIVPTNGYLQRLNELFIPIIEQTGYGDLLQSPPSATSAAFYGSIIVPQKFLARTPRQRSGKLSMSISSGEFDVSEYPWNLPFFEDVMTEELVHALFYQLRREWRGDYVKAKKALGKAWHNKVSSVNEALAQYTKEVLARSRPQRSLYAVADKILGWWGNALERDYYRAVDAMASAGYSLGRIAMIDSAEVPRQRADGVYVDFCREHPSFYSKRQKFLGAKPAAPNSSGIVH